MRIQFLYSDGCALSRLRSALVQCKDHERLVVGASLATDGGGNSYILLSVFALIGHRDRLDVVIEFSGPEFFAGPGLKCPESAVGCRTNKQQTACGDHGTAESR